MCCVYLGPATRGMRILHTTHTSNAENMISLYCVELIKQQTKNLINNLTQGPTLPDRVRSHWELCNFFSRLHLVVGTFSLNLVQLMMTSEV